MAILIKRMINSIRRVLLRPLAAITEPDLKSAYPCDNDSGENARNLKTRKDDLQAIFGRKYFERAVFFQDLIALPGQRASETY